MAIRFWLFFPCWFRRIPGTPLKPSVVAVFVALAFILSSPPCVGCILICHADFQWIAVVELLGLGGVARIGRGKVWWSQFLCCLQGDF
jgi:hypothetical protein